MPNTSKQNKSRVMRLQPRLLAEELNQRFAPPSMLLDMNNVVLDIHGKVEPYLNGVRPTLYQPLEQSVTELIAISLATLCDEARIIGKTGGLVNNSQTTAEAIDGPHGQPYVLVTFAFGTDQFEGKATADEATTRLIKQELDLGAGLIELDHKCAILSFNQAAREFIPVLSDDIGRNIFGLRCPVLEHGLNKQIKAISETSEPEITILPIEQKFIKRTVIFIENGFSDRGCYVLLFRDNTQEIELENSRQRLLNAQAELVRNSVLMVNSDDPTPILQNICDFLESNLDINRIGILLSEKDKKMAQLVAGAGWPRGVVGKSRVEIDPDTEFSAVMESKSVEILPSKKLRSMTLSDLTNDFSPQVVLTRNIGFAGNNIGVLVAHYGPEHQPSDTDELILTTMANLAAVSIRNADRSRETAFHVRHQRDLIDSLPVQIGILDKNFCFTSLNKQFEELGWTLIENEQPTLADIFGEDCANQIKSDLAAKVGVAMTEALADIPGQHDQVFLIHCVPRNDGVAGYYLAALNIDDRKRSEELNKTISEELDHRVKNILALVSSIAFLTGQYSSSIDDFLEAFEQRLSMLGRTHSLLSNQRWKGSTVDTIVSAELSPFLAMSQKKVVIKGPTIELHAKGTQTLAMIVHELITNAIKYGAFSPLGGTVSVEWNAYDKMLVLRWKESGVALPETNLKRTGFGTNVIENTITRQLRGTVQRELAADGICYTFTIPLKSISQWKDDD